MTDFGWKARSSRDDIFPEEDDKESKSRVRLEKSKGESSSNRKTSPDTSKDKDKERRHKHKHHHKHKKSRKGSRSRSRSKSPNRKRGSPSPSRDRHRYRGNRRDERDEAGSRGGKKSRKSRSRSGSGSRKRDRPKGAEQGTMGGNALNSSDDDLDLANTAQPFSTGPVPLAATKLKAEIEKRKQLWSKKDKPTETATSSTAWKQTAFSDDNDGKVSAKFKRLMGIKDTTTVESKEDHAVSKMSDTQRQEYFANLEKQYEVARATTHTQRGLGLGFSSRSLFPR